MNEPTKILTYTRAAGPYVPGAVISRGRDRERVQERYINAPVRLTEPTENAPEGILSGVAVVYDVETEIWPGEFEKIHPDALKNALARPDDVRGLLNHDPNIIWGRNLAGNLELWSESDGLHFTGAPDREIMYNRDILRNTANGLYNQCSFRFSIDTENYYERPDGSMLYEITDLHLYDISIVTFPAYDTTHAEARTDPAAVNDAPADIPRNDPGADLLEIELNLY